VVLLCQTMTSADVMAITKSSICSSERAPAPGRGFHDRSVAALLTGSSRQRLNGFGSRRIKRADLLFRAKHVFLAANGGNFPLPSGQGWGLGPSSASILNGNSLNPDNAKGALPPAHPPLQTCRRPIVLPTKVECRHNEPTPQVG
jgi:hypothetical protein